MNGPRLETPVAFFIFNRPETTEKVFAAIAEARPAKLLVIADGPRPDRPGEAERCQAARAIVDRVDWACQLMTHYSDMNLGCGKRVSSGLDWVFSQVEEAIILEDDCLPHPTFFRFCTELLEFYRHDERVMHIGGNNFQAGRTRGEGSYYFSRYPHVWGWATWRRAWQMFDFDMALWSRAADRRIYLQPFPRKEEREYWTQIWDSVCAGVIDSWAYRWTFACTVHAGLAITPNVNLVSNIGFGPNGTHTKARGAGANVPQVAMDFPLRHPQHFLKNDEADEFTRRIFFSSAVGVTRILGRAQRSVIRLASRWGLG